MQDVKGRRANPQSKALCRRDTPVKLEVTWIKCQGGDWCEFAAVNLDHEHLNGVEGVYIIWQESGSIIRLGQGVIKDRLADHRQNNEIVSYGKMKKLRVTWTQVDKKNRDGVEKYLADTLNPLVGDRFPNRTPIEVNLPWNLNK